MTGCEKYFLGGVGGDLVRRRGIFKEERGILRKMRVFKEGFFKVAGEGGRIGFLA